MRLVATFLVFCTLVVFGHGRAFAADVAQDLLAIEGDLNGMCRGWPGVDPHTEDVCAVRDKVDKLLGKIGYCFGKEGQIEADKRWHKCTKGSIRF